MATKLCSKCLVEKEFNAFHNNKRTKDGKQVWCKDCVNEKNGITHKNLKRQPCVYFVEAEGLEKLKIGVTDVLYHRLATLKNGCPVPLKVLAIVRLASYVKAKELEAWAKDVCKPYRVHGEWFHIVAPIRRLTDKIASKEVPILTDEQFDLIFKT